MNPPTALTRLGVGEHPARWRSFVDPHTVWSAARPSEVEDALRRAEDLARAGSWVVGALAYEAAPAFDPTLVTHPPGTFPLAWFAAFDRARPSPGPVTRPFRVGSWSGLDAEAHARAFDRILSHIRDGDTYQVNHTERLRAPFAGSPFGLFAALSAAQPTDHQVYLDLGRHVVCSVSPELFVRRTGDLLTTTPMKGTAPRSGDPVADAASAAGLRSSVKDVAENIMIVDLLRNDLARVSRPGTVKVRDLCSVQTLPTLHTMTSTVEGDAVEGLDLVGLFRSVFPCGSVTGAPKGSTMGLIAAVEPTPRGVYCGALGLVAPGGDATFSVPIRTAVVDTHEHVVEYGVGSGITHASSAEAEFAELLTKARVLRALDAAPDGEAHRGTRRH